MPDDLKELQQAVKVVQQGPRRRRAVDWLRLVGTASRLAFVIGVLILAGVAGSVLWPYAGRIKEVLRPRPAPAAASAPVAAARPVVVAAPGSQAGTAGPSEASVRAKASPASGRSGRIGTMSSQAVVGGPDAPPAGPPALHRVGEIFAVGSWEYCINEATWRTSLKVADKTVKPADGSEFLDLRLTVCNLGEETAILPPPRLAGPDGRQIEASGKVGVDAASGSEPLSPDRHYHRQVVFEVPRRLAYKVVLSGGWMSDTRAAVEVAR